MNKRFNIPTILTIGFILCFNACLVLEPLGLAPGEEDNSNLFSALALAIPGATTGTGSGTTTGTDTGTTTGTDTGTTTGTDTGTSTGDSSTYTVGGMISGLTGTVTLQNNADDDLDITVEAHSFLPPNWRMERRIL